MATTQPQSLSTLLTSLTTSLSSALECLPPSTDVSERKAFAVPPEHGISLLDTKNELFLEYLRNLVFLMVVRIRRLSGRTSKKNDDDEEDTETDGAIDQDIVKHLVHLRVYLEKGVRPLEARLKYQVDKVVRAAEDAARAQATSAVQKAQKTKHQSADSASASDSSNDSAESGSGSGSASDEGEDDAAPVDDLAHRPNLSAFRTPATTQKPTRDNGPSDNIYRPPRINPTALPDSQPKPARRPQKSHTLDDYITHELSTAPVAEPSIGSTIVSSGRRHASNRERAEDAERRAYEESNLVRLPALSKKEMGRRNARGQGAFGGEDFRSIGDSVGRIGEVTKGKKGALERSRKRGRETVDGGRGSGIQGGEAFERKKRKFFKGRS